MKDQKEKRLAAEIRRINAIAGIEDEKRRAKKWGRYSAHFNRLPESLRPLVVCELCKVEPSRGSSGFHGLCGSMEDPVSFCGWADYGEGLFHQGVGFCINRACFGDRDVELYYTDSDMLEDIAAPGNNTWREQWLRDMLETMKVSSSGIDDVRLHQELEESRFRFCGRQMEPCRVKSFRFRLNASKIKETVSLSGKSVPTSAFGGYLFVLPRAGEFYCELGEVIDGKRVPLHIDDFCMK